MGTELTPQPECGKTGLSFGRKMEVCQDTVQEMESCQDSACNPFSQSAVFGLDVLSLERLYTTWEYAWKHRSKCYPSLYKGLKHLQMPVSLRGHGINSWISSKYSVCSIS